MAEKGLFVEREAGVGAGIDFTDPNSPLARYYLRFGHCAFAVLLALIFVLLNFTPLWHTDIWAHLRFGEHFLQTGTFPNGEPFSPFGDKAVGPIHTAWLSQAIYSEAYRVGVWFDPSGSPEAKLAQGTSALRFLHSVLVTARLALLYWAFLRLSRSSIMATLGILFIAMIGLGNLGIARPQVFAELMFAAMLVPLSRPALSWRGVVIIPALIALWANLHGSFPIAFFLLGGIFLGRSFTLWRTGAPLITDQCLQRLAISAIAALLAVAMLNPEGPSIFLTTAKMAGHPNVLQMDEWQPIYSLRARGAQWTLGLCVAILVVTMLTYRGSLSAEHWILAAIFGASAVARQRGVVWFVTLTPWIAMPYWGKILARTRPAWWTSVPSLRKTMFVIAIGVLAAIWSIPIQRLIESKPATLAREVAEGTPWRLALAVADPEASKDTPLAQRIQSTYPGGKFTGTIFATEVLGDFFLWASPGAPVFVYSHVHLFPQHVWQQYQAVRSGQPNWRQILDDAKVNLVVVTASNNQSLRERLQKDPDWVVVLDETGDPSKHDPRWWLFAALRKQPR